MMWRVTTSGYAKVWLSSLALGTHLASGLGRARKKWVFVPYRELAYIKLLAIVETIKEFNGMLWGQRINVYTNHKNLTRDGLGLTSDRVTWWRILLEEYAPKIIYIKGIHNTVADAILWLEYDHKLNSIN
jgi:hypothetical protein